MWREEQECKVDGRGRKIDKDTFRVRILPGDHSGCFWSQQECNQHDQHRKDVEMDEVRKETSSLAKEERRQLIQSSEERHELFGKWIMEMEQEDRRVMEFFDAKFPFRKPLLIDGITIWSCCSIHPDAIIGEGSVIGHGVNITGPVVIGKHVRIQSYVFIPEGITIEDMVFIGPGVVFTNVKYPKVRARDFKVYSRTLVKRGANIGAGCIIGPDVTIGENSTIGMGSVVLKDVREGYIVRGSPAQHVRRYVEGSDVGEGIPQADADDKGGG